MRADFRQSNCALIEDSDLIVATGVKQVGDTLSDMTSAKQCNFHASLSLLGGYWMWIVRGSDGMADGVQFVERVGQMLADAIGKRARHVMLVEICSGEQRGPSDRRRAPPRASRGCLSVRAGDGGRCRRH